MLDTTAIPQRDDVLLTGTTAIGVVMPIGQEGAEHTVIHVKQRHVLMQGDLKPSGIHTGGKIQQLLQVEVVAGGHPLQPPVLEVPANTERVGRVQGKITDAGSQWREAFQLIGIAPVSYTHLTLPTTPYV